MQTFFKPEEIEEAQKKINEANDAFNQSRGEEHQKKIRAIQQALKLFNEANLPVLLFADHEAASANGQSVMVQYNNIREICLKKDGDIEASRFMKKVAYSISSFINGFIYQFLVSRRLMAPKNLFPVLFFELFSDLDPATLDSVKKSEDEFTEKMRKQTKAKLN